VVTLREVETIIVGGGPAGSSCAWQLHKAGRECLVLDRKAMPRPKLCAGWITPKVLSDLELPVDQYPHGILKLDRIRLFFGRRLRFAKQIPTDQYSIRRIEFDAFLLQRSGACTAQHTVRSIRRENDHYIIDDTYRCRYLVGAGGTNCPDKKSFFSPDRGELIVTQEVEYECDPPSSTCTLWFPYAGAFGYAWYVPKVNAINIGFGGLRRQLIQWDKVRLWTTLIDLLRKHNGLTMDPPAPKGYSYYLGQQRKKVECQGAFLIGDAAGLATTDLAEGIGPAVESGILVARDILGAADYSTRAILKHSLPWSLRLIRRMVNWIP
jgi:flavin-dependent dehydrogenase